jgi:hypothetical protein
MMMGHFAWRTALMLTCGLTFVSGLQNRISTQPSDEWNIHSIPEVVQGKDESVPVVVFGIAHYPAKNIDQRMLGVKLHNRSSKQVKAVSLRWLITVGKDRIERKRVYQWHKLDAVEVVLIGGQRQEIKLQTPKPDMTIEPFVEANRRERIEINIGVGEVEFADGSVWKEPEPISAVSSNNRLKVTPQWPLPGNELHR